MNVFNARSEGQTIISALNSFSETIGAGLSKTGEWEDVSNYPSITIAPKATQNGTYYLEFSDDGVSVFSTLTRYYRTTRISPPHKFGRSRKYCRVVFTNTSASDSDVTIQTIFGETDDLNIPIDAVVAQDYDAKIVRTTDYHYEVALGLRQGNNTWNKFGYNADLDTGVSEYIWAVGGNLTQLTVGTTLEVLSSDANDTALGTGARSVILYGVNQNREAIIEVVAMNGAGAVVTTNQYLGLNRVSIYLSGTGGANAGNITIRVSGGGSTQGYIPIGEGTTQQAFFFTQANHTALADWFSVTCLRLTGGGGNPRITIRGWVKSFVSGSKYLVLRESIDTSVENHLMLTPSQPFVIGEKSIFWVEATSDKDNTEISCRFSLIEVRSVSA